MTTIIEPPISFPASALPFPAPIPAATRARPSSIEMPTPSIRPVPLIETFSISRGIATICPAELLPPELLASTRISQQICDHRYYDVVHRTLGHDFPLSYIVLRDRSNNFRGAQPFFVVDQNILAGMQGKIAYFAEKVRKKYPRFMTLKTLMLGNPAGPGAPGIALLSPNADPDAEHHWFTTALGEALAAYSHKHRVRVVVFKDFPAEHRPALAGLADVPDFVRIPSMPMTRLSLEGYTSFDDYLAKALSKVTRKSTRRKLKESAGEKIQLSITNDISDCIDDVYRLYLQVYNRAGLKFEKLTPQYLLELGRCMPDRVRFFLWRRQGQLVAVSITLVQLPAAGVDPTNTALIDLYLGMEYPLALDLHLYFLTMRDVIQWCIDNKISTYYSTPLNYDAKLHFRHKLVPQDLYVRHASPILNPAFKFAMRFAEPTRHDKIIPQFPNAHEL